MNYVYINEVSSRLNNFVWTKGGWFTSEKHPDWVKQFCKEFFTPTSNFHRAGALKLAIQKDILLYEEIQRHGIKSAPRHFELRRTRRIQKFKPVKNIPIPKNSQ
jgi:hypothetical protein